MVWQEGVSLVVMLTNIMDASMIRCQQYWPESGSENYGPFRVTNTGQQQNTHYCERHLQVKVIFLDLSLLTSLMVVSVILCSIWILWTLSHGVSSTSSSWAGLIAAFPALSPISLLSTVTLKELGLAPAVLS